MMEVFSKIRTAARVCILSRCAPSGRRKWARRGFTLIELLLAMTIMGLLAGIAAHPLHAALERVRVVRAIAEISTLQREIAMYETERGVLPPTLADIGRGGMLDPWGRPYAYVPFPTAGGGGNGNGGGGNGNGGGGNGNGGGGNGNGGGGNGGGGGGNGGGGGIAGIARKDRFLVPINSTYDLYSVGADGKSTGPLTASISHDDVIRANDGGYVGLASGY
jgi:general secretion pathway protein G